MRLYRIIIFLVIFQFMFVLPLHAGTIEGRVMCNDGKPLPKTTIKVVGKKTVETNSHGYYSLNLRKGRYLIKIKRDFFEISVYPYDTPRDFYVDCNK